MRPGSATKKLVQRAVIVGAGGLAIISGVGGADLLAQARADDPPCVAGAATPCLVDLPRPDPPPRSHVRVYCQPLGTKFGAFCFRKVVP